MKNLFPTLGRLRLTVQIAMLVLTVWGANLVGYYMAEKVSGNLPALSCAYDKQTGGYCELISLQHVIHHRVGETLAQAGAVTLQALLPLAFSLLTFFAFFVLLNKAFCGWICPLGTVQELLNRLGRRLNLPLQRLEPGNVGRVRPVKWLLLLTLVLILPLLTGLGVTPHGLGNPYCDVCPSRIVTTLLSGDTEQLAMNVGGTLEFTLGAIANTLVGFILVAAFAVRQPFCRICPMLSLNAAFQRLGLLRLVKKQNDKCDKCGVCAKACPMDIVEIAREHGAKAFHEDCTLCGRCAEFCPDDRVIQLKFGPIPVFSSSRDYYKQRIRLESPEGGAKNVVRTAKEQADHA